MASMSEAALAGAASQLCGTACTDNRRRGNPLATPP
jgi:hypothetical protein